MGNSTGPSELAPMPPEEEKTLWEGSSSQLLNLPVFVVCALAIGLLVGSAILFQDSMGGMGWAVLGGLALLPAAIAVTKYLRLKYRHYQFTTQRLNIRQGIFSRKTDAIELYRVKDYVLIEPFLLRLFGLGHLILITDDVVNPRQEISAVPRARALRDEVRNHVELCRDRKRVRVTEFEGGGPVQ